LKHECVLSNTGKAFAAWTASMALRFTATGALLAARRKRIFLMNQNA
jgi:hypothetical protein